MEANKTSILNKEEIIKKMNFLCQIGRGDSPEMENLEALLAKLVDEDEKAGLFPSLFYCSTL